MSTIRMDQHKCKKFIFLNKTSAIIILNRCISDDDMTKLPRKK